MHCRNKVENVPAVARLTLADCMHTTGPVGLLGRWVFLPTMDWYRGTSEPWADSYYCDSHSPGHSPSSRLVHASAYRLSEYALITTVLDD